MTWREQAMREHPDFPWLVAGDRIGVQHFLRQRGWIEDHESIESCDPAGNGNMNLTLLVETRDRSFILKQARPWVERYPEIRAPWDRGVIEARFYARVAAIEPVARRMPRMLACDPESRSLALEYLPGRGDCSDLYDAATGACLVEGDIETAADFLARLHEGTRGKAEPGLANREMRALNHAHIFEIPFASDAPIDLEAFEPGLCDAARAVRADRRILEITREVAAVYLSDGPCLLHGDYFPGSWLRGAGGLFVIDPEFCFFGAPEVDLGCAIAHFALSDVKADVAEALLRRYGDGVGAAGAGIDAQLLGRFAAIEVIRRLIGVAQLPIPVDATPARGDAHPRFRSALLERASEALLAGEWPRLFS
jgi:5-methylthioribose kinase